MSTDETIIITREDLDHCTRVLEAVAEDPRRLSPLTSEDRVRLFMAAGRTIHPEVHQIRRRIKDMRQAKRRAKELKDREVRSATNIRTARLEQVFIPPPRRVAALESDAAEAKPALELEKPRDCYICKKEFTRVHFFYDAMCPECADFNYEKRFQTAPLTGRVALITGARMKIGYQAALMLLRAGARVIVSTRFPRDAAFRFAREEDFGKWKDRLEIYGLDLRHSPSVEVFAQMMDRKLDRLDYLINNAAQTVRRPPGFYAHLLEQESLPYTELPPDVQGLLAGHESFKQTLLGDTDSRWLSDWHAGALPEVPGLTSSAALSQIPYRCEAAVVGNSAEFFPQGKLDADLQQVDVRSMNSWRMTLADVPTAEMLEVQLVNSVAPFILCAKLKGLMVRAGGDGKHIVNVSAMEGKFNRHTKTDKHPHTNMAKAALNMLTLTSARDYARSGIYMNAVDTGWVTDEDPAAISARKKEEHDFQPPLDIVDGAGRVCDPIFSGVLTGKHSWGNFLKDYYPTSW